MLRMSSHPQVQQKQTYALRKLGGGERNSHCLFKGFHVKDSKRFKKSNIENQKTQGPEKHEKHEKQVEIPSTVLEISEKLQLKHIFFFFYK